ncbi:dihydrolipoyl dehydrogenase [Phytoactinopolyspora endophytica]|uniref:dihydrolipoyl dehydrogenase n=1 Tax=Phytoactinopolyspora endophytica TaxID=1642495 RepID=UPI00101CA3FA|nr:dihydrolipoyl dehydrogenase [Phytoactinopolyspora endophytica]
MNAEAYDYDVVVLGGGSGGYAAAFRAAELGLRVALVEKDKVGGTCLHYGCIPTKALLHAAEVADITRGSDTFGVKATFESVDVPAVNAYKDGIVARLYKGLQGLVKANRVTLVEGMGRLAGPNAVEVDGTRYTGANVVLATGSDARSLPGLQTDGRQILTSYDVLNLDRVPTSAVVLGGGVIGVEFASVWRSFGAEVTLVEMLPRLLPGEDEASSKTVERAFRKRGMTVKTGARFADVQQADAGITVSLEGGESIDAELMLVAVGRGPVTEGLGYAEAGITLDGGFVTTDERLRTGVPGVYAVGDVVPGLQLAHRGFAHGIFVAEEIAGLAPVPVDDTGIPRVTYSDPEVASVGLTEAQARQRLGDDQVETFDYNLAGNGKSQILGTQGFAKLVREKDGPVLGVHLVGARVGELIGEAQLICNWEALPEEVAQLIHPHPTQSEALGEAHLALAGKPLHVHG